MASIAVPGTLKGFIHLYKECCSLSLDEILEPILTILDQGASLTPKQPYVFSILNPILKSTEYGQDIFDIEKHGRLYNPLLKEFLLQRSTDEWEKAFYGSGAAPFLEDVREGNGLLSAQDLKEYQVIEREPVSVDYRDYKIISNPYPSFGGSILCKALSILQKTRFEDKNPIEKAFIRADIMQMINHFKGTGGTTHLNVIDANNNAAALSLSTGTSCGYFFPKSGILLNNMMGESDLHPEGFFTRDPGERIPSMMSPTFIKEGEGIFAALGSGGSNRIRSAILQVVLNIIDEKLSIKDSIEASRIHFDENEVLQIEPGFPKEVVQALCKKYPENNVWEEKDLYFGGVHVATGRGSGWGDPRRDGYYEHIL